MAFHHCESHCLLFELFYFLFGLLDKFISFNLKTHQRTGSSRRHTTLHPALILLDCSSHDVLVFLEDGRQTFKQLVGLCI